MHKPWQGL